MDFGITEEEFWNMTLAELTRQIESRQRVEKRQKQEQAYFIYQEADLIGRSVARLFSGNQEMPKIYEVFSNIFDEDEIKRKEQEVIDEIMVARFKTFTKSFNSKFKEVKENE